VIRVHIFCEGQTEDSFVREVLQPHFDTLSIWLNPIILGTGSQGRGGIRNSFETPEHIDDGRDTAPSKRILAVCDEYDKIAHGSLIAMDIGLDTIRHECPLFDAWVKRLEAL
jgi:hypothetical protein